MNALTEKRLLVTRAAGQYESLAGQIRQRGGIPLPFPCLAVQCLPKNIRKAFASIPDDAAILFSSANGVDCAAQALGDDFAAHASRHPVIVVGQQTAGALQAHGIEAAWIAEEASQEGLIEGFATHGLPPCICFLRAEDGRDVLQQALQKREADIRLVHAYRTICPEDSPVAIVTALQQGEVDAVLLGSSRTAQHYVQRIGDAELADRPVVAVISRQVALAARQAGLSVQVVAKEASFTAMLDGLEDYFAGLHQDETRSPVEETRP